MGKGLSFVVGALLLIGCATHRIPTPCGDMVFMSLLYGRELPTGSYTVIVASPAGVTTTAVIRIEGYKSYPEKEAIKATGESVGTVAGTAGGTLVKVLAK